MWRMCFLIFSIFFSMGNVFLSVGKSIFLKKVERYSIFGSCFDLSFKLCNKKIYQPKWSDIFFGAKGVK